MFSKCEQANTEEVERGRERERKGGREGEGERRRERERERERERGEREREPEGAISMWRGVSYAPGTCSLQGAKCPAASKGHRRGWRVHTGRPIS